MRGVARAVFIAALFLPLLSHADVVISEFLYDAPGSDSGQEWVELFNAGLASVDLTKWKINDGSNHILNVPPKNGGIGSIFIPAGGYLILADNASNFESSYPSVANVIDSTVSLPNTSGTISLLDDSGAIVDSLSYTKDIGAAGDGNTLQRTAVSSTTVIPGSPTPSTGALSASDSSSSNDSNATSSSSSESTSTTQSQEQSTPAVQTSSYVAPPSPDLFADAGPDRTVIVGADVQFNARAYDRSKKAVEKARFVWNFGDGTTAEGESVLHHFSYPGKYALVLTIAEDKFAARDEIVVTAEPAKLGFAALPDGGVQIDNFAGRDLDLSGWIIRAGSGLLPPLFLLPPHSIILSGSSMHISRATLNFSAGQQAELQYPNGVIALQAGQSTGALSAVAPVIPAAHVTPPLIINPAPIRTAKVEVIPAVERVAEEDDDGAVVVVATSEVAAASTASPDTSTMWWFIAGGLALAAGASLVAARRFGKAEWNIVDDGEDAK